MGERGQRAMARRRGGGKEGGEGKRKKREGLDGAATMRWRPKGAARGEGNQERGDGVVI